MIAHYTTSASRNEYQVGILLFFYWQNFKSNFRTKFVICQSDFLIFLFIFRENHFHEKISWNWFHEKIICSRWVATIDGFVLHIVQVIGNRYLILLVQVSMYLVGNNAQKKTPNFNCSWVFLKNFWKTYDAALKSKSLGKFNQLCKLRSKFFCFESSYYYNYITLRRNFIRTFKKISIFVNL